MGRLDAKAPGECLALFARIDTNLLKGLGNAEDVMVGASAYANDAKCRGVSVIRLKR